MKLLLSKGADPNGKQLGGESCVSYAANKDSIDIVRLLLQRGAKPDNTGPGSLTALGNAVHKENSDMVALLLEHGAKPRVRCGGAALVCTKLHTMRTRLS